MAIAVGAKFVRDQQVARTSTSNTTAASITYDSAQYADTGYTYNGPDVAVDTAGKYLFLFDLGDVDHVGSTRDCGTLVPRVNTTDQNAFRATHRFLRGSAGAQAGGSFGSCILDLAVNDTVEVRNPGALTPTDAVGTYATTQFTGGMQMFRLPDINFTDVRRTVDAAEVGRSAITSTRPWISSSGTWTTVTYNSEVNDDDGLYSGSGGDITLKANKKYLICWGVTAYEDTNVNRHTYIGRLQIGGTAVQYCSAYQRNLSSEGPPLNGFYLHEVGVSNETLRVQMTHEVEAESFTPNVSDAYCQVIELNDGAEWIHIDASTTDVMTTDFAFTSTWTRVPFSTTFRADGDADLIFNATNNSVDNDSGGTLSILAITWAFLDRDVTGDTNRKSPRCRFLIGSGAGGTTVWPGRNSAYSRGLQGNDSTYIAALTAGIVEELDSTDELKWLLNDPSFAGNADLGIYASGNRHFLGMQVLNLGTLANPAATSDITDINDVTVANITSMNGVTAANISKVNGVNF